MTILSSSVISSIAFDLDVLIPFSFLFLLISLTLRVLSIRFMLSKAPILNFLGEGSFFSFGKIYIINKIHHRYCRPQ